MKKFNEQQIREDYANGDLTDELDELIDLRYADYSPSEVLAELGSWESARAWALEQYIDSARAAYDDAAIEAYERQKDCSDA